VTFCCLRYEFLKLGRCTWAGHVMRMRQSDPTKKALCTKRGGNGDQKKRQTKAEVVRRVRGARRTGWVQNLVN
jgi:hypothetical protein